MREDQKLQIQETTDIVRLIGEQIALRPKGKDFVGLCPFHNDRNPSLAVSPQKQIFKCFSCQAGGDVFSFVMKYHKMTFPEALKYLAERVGIKLQPLRSRERSDAEPTDRQRILKANQLAVSFYRSLLKHPEHGRMARDYIDRRGISPEMVELFQIGYAADRWDGLAMTIAQRHWDLNGFELAGLTSPRKNSEGYYDQLRHRLIFPILDGLDRPVAFGGRKLRDEDEPKYLNSPESLLFNKSSTLYGLHAAKRTMIDRRVAVVVEGYTDVIACHQAGLSNVVATLGTALTPQHVNELRRYVEKVILLFDADEAGQHAADRSVEIFLTEELDVTIALLPDGLDPAELLQQEHGAEQWHAMIGEATDALQYQFNRVAGQIHDADTVTGRQKIVEQYLQRLAQLGLYHSSMLRRALVIQRLSALLRMGEEQIGAILKRLSSATAARSRGPGIPNDQAPPARNRTVPGTGTLPLAERQLIGCLFRNGNFFQHELPDGRTLHQAMTPEQIVSPTARRLYQMIYQRLAEGRQLKFTGLLAELAEQEDQALVQLATTAEVEVETILDGDEQRLGPLFASAVQTILEHHRREQYQQTREVLAAVTRGRKAEDAESSASNEDELLRQIAEQARAQVSPARIARLGLTPT